MMFHDNKLLSRTLQWSTKRCQPLKPITVISLRSLFLYCAHVILYPPIFFIRFLKRMNLKQDKSSTCSKITVLCELSLVLYDSSSNNIKKVCAQFFPLRDWFDNKKFIDRVKGFYAEKSVKKFHILCLIPAKATGAFCHKIINQYRIRLSFFRKISTESLIPMRLTSQSEFDV